MAVKDFVKDETGINNTSTANIHGPWVAAAIAANASNDSYDGIAPDADLLIGRVMDEDEQGSVADIIAGVGWAENNDADIISMSLGTPVYSPALARAMRDALNGSTTVIVVAVGNSLMNPAVRYVSSPSDVPTDGVIGVAAMNASEPYASAHFSNVGPDPARDQSGGATVGQARTTPRRA